MIVFISVGGGARRGTCARARARGAGRLPRARRGTSSPSSRTRSRTQRPRIAPPGPEHEHDMSARKFTREEIAKRDSKTETMFIIDNVVYGVTAFLDEHPGGHEVLVNVAGKDASEDFDDVGHSLDAKELMKKYALGELVDEDKVELKKRTVSWEDNKADSDTSVLSSWQLPVLLGIIVTLVYSYLFG